MALKINVYIIEEMLALLDRCLLEVCFKREHKAIVNEEVQILILVDVVEDFHVMHPTV